MQLTLLRVSSEYHGTAVIQYWCDKASESLWFHVSEHLMKTYREMKGGERESPWLAMSSATCTLPGTQFSSTFSFLICMSFWLFPVTVKKDISAAYRERNAGLPEGKGSIYQCLLFKFLFSFCDFPPCNTKDIPMLISCWLFTCMT